MIFFKTLKLIINGKGSSPKKKQDKRGGNIKVIDIKNDKSKQLLDNFSIQLIDKKE